MKKQNISQTLIFFSELRLRWRSLQRSCTGSIMAVLKASNTAPACHGVKLGRELGRTEEQK